MGRGEGRLHSVGAGFGARAPFSLQGPLVRHPELSILSDRFAKPAIGNEEFVLLSQSVEAPAQ